MPADGTDRARCTAGFKHIDLIVRGELSYFVDQILFLREYVPTGNQRPTSTSKFIFSNISQER